MTRASRTQSHVLISAKNAVDALFGNGFAELHSTGATEAIFAHGEIEQALVTSKSSTFYRHFAPLRNGMLALLADAYRRYFKLALAHLSQPGNEPDIWAETQLQPAVWAALEWIRDWYVLACDGPVPFVPAQTVSTTEPPSPPPTSWRAPSWLFNISLALFGVGMMKPQHVPGTDSEEKLGESHTRLLFKGARRVFLWELGGIIQEVRNEETAAAGAIRVETVSGQKPRTIKREGWQKRLKLYSVIRIILSANPGLQGMKFCTELDKRHAQPLFDWEKSGEWRSGLTWKEAWKNPNLRRKIRRVRQEAQKAPLD
jgi:hypothetical protein